MQAKLVAKLVSLLLMMLTPELLKKFADFVLDFVEDFVAGTKSPVDDLLLLPLCKMIRVTFDIPDNDEAESPDQKFGDRGDED